MFTDALRSVWVEVNLSNLDYNVKQIYKKIGPDPEMLAVIKADAYGHGVRRVAEVLRENGVKTFAVSTMSEVVTLREAGANSQKATAKRSMTIANVPTVEEAVAVAKQILSDKGAQPSSN